LGPFSCYITLFKRKNSTFAPLKHSIKQ